MIGTEPTRIAPDPDGARSEDPLGVVVRTRSERTDPGPVSEPVATDRRATEEAPVNGVN